MENNCVRYSNGSCLDGDLERERISVKDLREIPDEMEDILYGD